MVYFFNLTKYNSRINPKKTMSFVHLHVHSHYSLLKAACTIPRLIDKCAHYNMPALALTDYGNMFGVLEFYFQALEKNLNPIIGCEVYYVADRFKKIKDPNAHFRTSTGGANTLVLLAKNQEGYRNLCRISTLGYQEGFYFVPRVDYRVLESHKSGLVALTGARKGTVFSLYQNKGRRESREEIRKLKKLFGPALHLEFLPKGIKGGKSYNRFLAQTAEEEAVSLVAAGDVHYVEKEESVVEDVLSCIGTNRTLADNERARLGASEFYFKSAEEMQNGFADDSSLAPEYKKACLKTLEIADSCRIRFQLKDKEGHPIYHLPRLASAKKSKHQNLKHLSERGLKARLKEVRLRGDTILNEKTYWKRLNYELKIISQMGFEGYFYIVQDFIRWAKDQSIPVGPGRGSGASSLVSYSLGITDLDPLPLNLIFERFLNPERISMPDFDIDFCQENRQRVIDYITENYGKDCTSHVITYGRLNVRAAIRDVGRVMGLTFQETDQIVKLIPDKLGITLADALKLEPRLKNRMEEDPQIKQLIQLAGMVEGLIRHVSIHAAGIIIADTPILEYAPLYKGAENENVIQYDLKHAEKIGLVKFDFLGLKTLTQIKETFRLVEQTKGKKISPQQISIKDPGIYEIMCQGDTVGIFQFEGRGITDLLIKARPTCFEDIVAINALYRPGPMSMIPAWLDRKKGAPVDYIFPELEPILNETYGIIVYQEQVQQIAVKIAGYSYGEADILRRAMGKKIQSVMNKQKERFLKGAKQSHYDLKKSERLFDLMAEFAKYGFNKSHAAAYCVLAAQTAWLKRYYPMEFFASQMTIDQRDSDKTAKYIRDAKKHKLPISPPHINSSDHNFNVKDGKIRFSLCALKGVGELAAKNIMAARQRLKEQRFSSLEDFFENVDTRTVNKKALESLVKAGALDNLGYSRSEISKNFSRFLNYAQKIREDRSVGQQSLFEAPQGAVRENSVQTEPAETWNHSQRLGFEKEVLGFYLSNHPLEPFKGLEKSLGVQTLEDAEKSDSLSSSVQVLGIFSQMKETMTKKSGKMMAFGHIEDSYGSLEVILFPDVYKNVAPLIGSAQDIFLIKGSLRKEKQSSGRLVAEEARPVNEFLKSVKQLKFCIPRSADSRNLQSLKELFIKKSSDSPSAAKLFVGCVMEQNEAFVQLKSPDIPNRITLDQELLQSIYKIFKSTECLQLS